MLVSDKGCRSLTISETSAAMPHAAGLLIFKVLLFFPLLMDEHTMSTTVKLIRGEPGGWNTNARSDDTNCPQDYTRLERLTDCICRKCSMLATHNKLLTEAERTPQPW